MELEKMHKKCEIKYCNRKRKAEYMRDLSTRKRIKNTEK